MDEYLFITLAKMRFDARLEARRADEAGTSVRPQYQLEEAASQATTQPSTHHSRKARWFVPGSEYGEQS